MGIAPQPHAPPSTLATVIGQVIDAFDAIGDATPIQVGKKYISESYGVGSPPRVVFVPDPNGQVRKGAHLGAAAMVAHGCRVFVFGRPGPTEVDVFEHAYTLSNRVIALLSVAASGRIEWGQYGGDSPALTDPHAAEVVLSFTFRRDVHHDPDRWALDAAADDTSDPNPLVPPGQAGELKTIDYSVEPLDPHEPEE